MTLKVNFTDEEASSEALSFDAIPSGKYYARLTDVELRECGPESKNPGKPYWNLEFTIQDGQYADRKVWTNCMLFNGALYTLAQLCKATGHEESLKTGKVPDAESLIAKEVIINVKKMRDTYREEKDGDGEPQWKNEVKGISKYEGESPSSAGNKQTKTGAGALLP